MKNRNQLLVGMLTLLMVKLSLCYHPMDYSTQLLSLFGESNDLQYDHMDDVYSTCSERSNNHIDRVTPNLFRDRNWHKMRQQNLIVQLKGGASSSTEKSMISKGEKKRNNVEHNSSQKIKLATKKTSSEVIKETSNTKKGATITSASKKNSKSANNLPVTPMTEEKITTKQQTSPVINLFFNNFMFGIASDLLTFCGINFTDKKKVIEICRMIFASYLILSQVKQTNRHIDRYIYSALNLLPH